MMKDNNERRTDSVRLLTRTLHHDPHGYACNMGYVVMQGDSQVYRGPYWRARMISLGSR